MKKLFLSSINNKQKIIIFYMDCDGKVTERYIRVLQAHKDSILAYCYYRKKVRSFKIDNILSAGQIHQRGA